MQGNSDQVKEISILDILLILRDKVWILLISAVLAFAGVICYCTFTYVPQYTSTASVYILRPQQEDSTNINTQDLAISNSIVTDCSIIAKSRDVLETVSEKFPDYHLSYAAMKNRLTVSHPESTHILQLTFRGDTPQQAADIVNAIVEEFQRKIVVMLNTEQVSLFDKGQVPNTESNSKYPFSNFIIAIAIVFAECIIFIAAALLDNKIKEQDDVEKYLGLTVLGDIPPIGGGSGQTYSRYETYGKYSKYGRYGKYGKYGKYGQYGANTAESAQASVKEETK